MGTPGQGAVAVALAAAGQRCGIHGDEHWRRVAENGLDLAEAEGVSRQVAVLFAILHDCRRENDGHDPGHGPRAADLAMRLGHDALGVSPAELAGLAQAMRLHDRGQVTDDPLIGVCWDADRLDLIRVGIRPDPRLLCTAAGRDPYRIALCTDHRVAAPTWQRLVERLVTPGRLTPDEMDRRLDTPPLMSRADGDPDVVDITPVGRRGPAPHG